MYFLKQKTQHALFKSTAVLSKCLKIPLCLCFLPVTILLAILFSPTTKNGSCVDVTRHISAWIVGMLFLNFSVLAPSLALSLLLFLLFFLSFSIPLKSLPCKSCSYCFSGSEMACLHVFISGEVGDQMHWRVQSEEQKERTKERILKKKKKVGGKFILLRVYGWCCKGNRGQWKKCIFLYRSWRYFVVVLVSVWV